MRLGVSPAMVTRLLFQSTHPCGVRHLSKVRTFSQIWISIHAPMWGATLIPKTNTYFAIEDCECHLDVKEKLLTWCSRTIAKGQPYANPNKNIAFRHYNLRNLNEYLHRNFNENDIGIIYQKLGNGINPKLAKKFIRSRLNMEELE